MLLASGFSLVWLFLGRLVLYRFRQAIHAQGVGISRIALVGYDARVETFIQALNVKGNSGYQFVGIINRETGTGNPQQVGASSTEDYQTLGKLMKCFNWCKSIGLICYSLYHQRFQMPLSYRFSMRVKVCLSKSIYSLNSPSLSEAVLLSLFLMTYRYSDYEKTRYKAYKVSSNVL